MCRGRGTGLAPGLGSGRELPLPPSAVTATVGTETSPSGTPSKAIVGIAVDTDDGAGEFPGSPMLIVGTFRLLLCRVRGGFSSGTLIVGITMGCLLVAGPVLKDDVVGLGRPGLISVDSLGGFQFVLKLTIGRPGLLLTAVGSGNLGLRSRNDRLVAARISSPRISSPPFMATSSEADGSI